MSFLYALQNSEHADNSVTNKIPYYIIKRGLPANMKLTTSPLLSDFEGLLYFDG